MSGDNTSAIAPEGRYLVTGGCGFIGSHVAEALAEQGHPVRIFDNLSSGRKENLRSFRDSIELLEGDIRDAAALRRAMDGVDYVVHEAALVSVPDSIARPAENDAINLTGTLNLLNAARDAGVRRIVFASTAAVYGNDPRTPKREDFAPRPESPYAVAKLCSEHYLRIFSHLYGIETVSLRYFNVYGPGQDPTSMYSGVISRFLDAVRKGSSPTVYGDGRQSRDFVFVSDVVQANLLALRAKAPKGEAYNIATGRATSLLDLLSALQAAARGRIEPRFEASRPGDIRNSVADIGRAGSALGFKPRHDLASGLRLLLDSVRS